MAKEVLKALVGRNLNLVQLRGSAPMDQLSFMSLADEFDQELNPHGTQRDLNNLHARQIAEYAQRVLGSDEKPGAFPEVLLNVRKTQVLSKIERAGESVNFDDLAPGDIVEVYLDLDEIKKLNKKYDPAISRVDGNHRLAATETLEEGLDWPIIPFALFVGLSKTEERSLFAAINGKQRKMNTSHLSNILAALGGDGLLLERKTMPLWFANKLADEGNIFQNRVYLGGSKEGLKEKLGYVPPITLKQLESAMSKMLDELGAFLQEFMPAQFEARDSEDAAEELVEQANKVAQVINRYWTSVSRAYPDAWAENSGKKRYILFESIGLSAFAAFGGIVTLELMNTKLSQENFDEQLKQLAAGFPIEKDHFEGYAGGGGATKVLNELVQARDSETSRARWAINNL